MKTVSLWIIRVALMVQFVAVLSVPVLIAAADSPRAIWMAEWLNPGITAVNAQWTSSADARGSQGRVIGVLRLRDGRLSFSEQAGQAEWALDVAAIKRVTTEDGTLTIELVTGDTYLVAVMEANLTPAAPKKVAATITRAMEAIAERR